MQKMDCQAIGYGYIIIPKALLKEQLIDCSPHEGEIEAFLKLLIKVNYSETKLTDHQRRTIVCKRGESLHSPERRRRAAVVYAGQRLSLRLWGRTASAACPAGVGTGAVLAGSGAAPAGPAGIAAAGSSPQKTGGAGQSAPRAKKKRKKTEKELAKHTAVVV